MNTENKNTFKPVLTCVALLVSFACTQASAEMSFGGNVELDTTMQSNADGASTDDFTQGGRVKLSAAGSTTIGTATLAGQGDVLVTKDGGTAVDDMWFSLGRNKWSVKFGRFEAMETFSKGTDTILNVLGNVKNYQGSAIRGRIGGDRGQIALNVAASDAVNLELGTVWGEEGESEDESAFSGFRPAISMDITDDLRVTASYESVENGLNETDGFALYVRYATDAFALKMNFADGEITEPNTAGTGTVSTDSTSANINIESGNIGLGFHTTENNGGETADTVYARYLFPNLMGSENTNAQIGLSYATNDDVVEDETALRLRFFHSF